MKYSKIKTGCINGFKVEDILVEIDINSRSTQQTFKIVGMPSTAVLESEKRVMSAIRNVGFSLPNGSIVSNLSPTSLRKDGSHFDLPIAVSLLEASQQIKELNSNYYIFGELGLNGDVRPVSGIALFLMFIKERDKNAKFIIPRGNEGESAFVNKKDVLVIDNLKDVENISINLFDSYSPNYEKPAYNSYNLDFKEIRGQLFAKRGIEIAASGFHNVLMRGTPGSGKTMIAKRLPTILPDMTKQEIIESTMIYSVAGYMNMIIEKRPFRSPHHTASSASIIGGGAVPKPGEISLAHNGVLFMDEFPEYRTDVIESLRQPLEDGEVTVTRAKSVANYPAKFMLIASQNPCPCGYYGDKEIECTCNMNQILNYNRKISGPILDRIDLRIDIPRVKIDELMSKEEGESSEEIKERVSKTFQIQIKRQNKLNGKLTNKELKKHANLSEKAENFLRQAANNLKLTARSVNRIIRISRTIADSFESNYIELSHVSEALNYRGSKIL